MKLYLWLTIFFLTSCSLDLYKNPSKSNDKLKLANEIRTKVATKLKEEKELYPCGSGGQMMNEVKMLALSFNYYKPLNVEVGRELLVSAVNELKNAVNSDERIHPYLFEYPFDAKNIEIRIFLYNSNNSTCKPGNLSVIKAIEGNLIYNIDDPMMKL